MFYLERCVIKRKCVTDLNEKFKYGGLVERLLT